MPEVWQVPQGSAENRLIAIVDGCGLPIAYDGTELLSYRVWPGGNLSTVLTGTPEWVTPSAGSTLVRLTEAQTAGLAVGQYRIQCSLQDLVSTWVYYDAVVAITSIPGAGTALPVYCSLQDMTDLCGWIEDLADLSRDEAGFARQRGKAREWWDGLLLRAYKGGGASQVGPGGYFMNTWAYRGTLLQSDWLRQLLANGALITTGAVGGQVRRANAYYALAAVCRQQIGRGDARNYQQLAAFFQSSAWSEAASCVCEIDVNGDGIGEIPIVLANTNTRYT